MRRPPRRSLYSIDGPRLFGSSSPWGNLSFCSATVLAFSQFAALRLRRTVSDRRDFTQSGRVESDGLQKAVMRTGAGMPVQPNCVTRNSENLCPPTFTKCSPPDSVTCANSSRQFDAALAAGTPTAAAQRIPTRNPVLDAQVLMKETWSNNMEPWVGCPKIEHGPGPDRGRNGGGQVLPNLLPLPAKSILKQDEPRANKVNYVIEIQGTA